MTLLQLQGDGPGESGGTEVNDGRLGEWEGLRTQEGIKAKHCVMKALARRIMVSGSQGMIYGTATKIIIDRSPGLIDDQ